MSGSTKAIVPLAVEAGIPVLTSLTYADFRDYDTVYQYFQTTEDLAEIAAKFFAEKNISKIGLLALNIEAGHALMDITKPKFEKEGIEVVGLEYYMPEDIDHRTQILKLAENSPEAIYVFDLRPDKIVKELKEQFNGIIVFTDTPIATNQHKTIPELEGVYAASQFYMIEGTEENKKFNELFGDIKESSSNNNKSNSSNLKAGVNAEAGFGYDVVYLIWKAYQNVDKQTTLADSITELKTFKGLAGEINLSSSHKPSIPVKMVKITNKKLMVE